MDRQLAVRDTAQTAALMEQVLVVGDLDKLSPQQRLDYILRVCEATGLSAATRPFEYIRLNNRLVLYARKDATDQLRRIHNVSLIDIKEHDDAERGIHIVWAMVRMPDGREDRDMGAVSTKGLTGDALVNALMKSVTKAKRRATLSICGLGMLDETEIETIPGAQVQAEGASGTSQIARVFDPPKADKPQVLGPTRPHYEPSKAKPEPLLTANSITCEGCKKPITDHYEGQGASASRYRADIIASKTFDKTGLVLCWKCYEESVGHLTAAGQGVDPIDDEVEASEPVDADGTTEF